MQHSPGAVAAFIRWLALFILGSTVLTGIFLATFSRILTYETMSSWPWRANTYALLPRHIFEIVEQQQRKEPKGEKSDELAQVGNSQFDVQALGGAVADVLPPEYLANKAEAVMQGISLWLEGSANRPEFEVSLQDQAKPIVTALSNELKRQVAELPVCTPSQAKAARRQGVFEASCRPKGVNTSREIDKELAPLYRKADSPLNKTFTGNDLNLSADTLEQGQRAYYWLNVIPWYFTAQAVFLAALIIFLNPFRRQGVWRVGAVLLCSGMLALALFGLITLVGKAVVGENTPAGLQAAKEVFLPLVQIIISDIGKTGLVISGAVMGTGAFLMAAAFALARYTEHAAHKPARVVAPTKPKEAKPEPKKIEKATDDDMAQILKQVEGKKKDKSQ